MNLPIYKRELPDSAFADPVKRRYPIYDKIHTLSVLMWMTRDIYGFIQQPNAEELHDRIVHAAKKFGIKHKKCLLCERTSEKVIFT